MSLANDFTTCNGCRMATAPTTKTPDLIGSAEVCERAGIDRSTLSRHVALGKIQPALRLPGPNGALLFERRAVSIYIATIKPERVA
jgi:predicted site-specific integrase-resolvase